MKILKVYITIAVINILCVLGVVGFGPIVKSYALSLSVNHEALPTMIPTPMAPSSTPTKKPVKRRVITVVRKASPAPLSGAAMNTTSTTGQQDPIPQQSNTSNTQASPVVPTDTPQPPQDTRCLIGIDGGTYDVTAFRSMHSGGNIFTCGTDMSSIFWSQHGASTLNQMAKYKI